jgi:acetyltransferase
MNASTPVETRDAILAALRDLAPEADLAALDAHRPLREQVDLDSLDWVNLVDAIGERCGVAWHPSRIAPQASLGDLVAAVDRARRHGRPRPSHPRRAAPIPVRPVRLRDGRRVTLRAVVADDAPREAAFVRALSLASRYKRFMSSLRELSPAKLKYFTDVDQVRHIALAAIATGDRRRTWIGVARSVGDARGDDCEFAVTVADDWQRSGLAGVLMRALMRAAAAKGFRTMHGVVLASNRDMLTLARQLGFAVQRQPDEPGTVRVHRALPAGATR